MINLAKFYSPEPFDLKNLKYKNLPERIIPFAFNEPLSYRCLHLLVRRKGMETFVLPDILDSHEELHHFLRVTKCCLPNLDFEYVYLTIDNSKVLKSHTQRTPGWHIDGLQGDEVPVKKATDISFVWSDTLPMEFANQHFDLPDYVTVSTHNIFDLLASYVVRSKIEQLDSGVLYAMNAYCVHRGVRALYNTNRTFIRVSYSNVPVTSTKMTVNPKITYDYEIHTTTGEIPDNLRSRL